MLNWLWYLTVVLSIWGAAFGGYHIPGLGTIFPFRIVILLVGLLVLIKCDKKKIKIKPVILYCTVLPVIIFLMCQTAVSAVWADSMPGVFSALLNLAYILIFVVLFLYFCRDDKVLSGTIIAIGCNLLVIFLFALLEIFSGQYIFNPAAQKKYSTLLNHFGLHHPAVCFDNTNNLAYCICLSVPILFYLSERVFSGKPVLQKLSLVFMAALSLFILIQTFSFIGYLTFGLVLVLCLVIRIKDRRRITVLLVVLSASTLLFCIGAFILYNSELIKRMPDILQEQTNSVNIRITLIKKAAYIMKDSYFLGVGPGNIDSFMKQTIIDSKMTKMLDIHEFYFEMGAVYGILPLAFLLYLQCKTYLASYRSIINSGKEKWIAMLCLPITIGFIPASAMLSSTMFFALMWIQFAVWSTFLYKKHAIT